MAKVLIIDGYNLLLAGAGHRGQARSDIAGARSHLVEVLNRYCLARGLTATVVFDGEQKGYPIEKRERHFGMEVVYSRRGEKADDVIKRLLASLGDRAILISSDNELISFAQVRGITALGITQFEKRLCSGGKGSEAAFDKSEEEDLAGGWKSGKKKGNPRRQSKKERKRMRDINRL